MSQKISIVPAAQEVEYAVTFRSIDPSLNPEGVVSIRAPEGDGWDLFGFSAVERAFGRVFLTWTWKRTVTRWASNSPQSEKGK